MPLQGTLDAFSLDEVLQMLGHARKTGALDVDAPSRVGGTIYLAGGRFCGAESGELTGKVATPEELEARLIDVCFALLRVEVGSFEFQPDRLPSWPVGAGIDVEPILDHVRGLVRDWSAIEDVIPSFESRPALARELARDSVTLDRDGWAVVSAVDGHTDVRGMARTLGRSVLDVAGVLKDLVDTGAVAIDGVAAPRTVAPAPVVPDTASSDAREASAVPADTVPAATVPADTVSVDLSNEERARVEPVGAATVPVGAPRRDVTPFDVAELVAAQAEAEREVEGSGDAAHPGAGSPTAESPTPVDAMSPLAEAVAEVAAVAEGTTPPPTAHAPESPAPPGSGPPATAPTADPGSVAATTDAGFEKADPGDADDSSSAHDATDDATDDGPKAPAPQEPPKPSARNRGEALRMFSSLRRT